MFLEGNLDSEEEGGARLKGVYLTLQSRPLSDRQKRSVDAHWLVSSRRIGVFHCTNKPEGQSNSGRILGSPGVLMSEWHHGKHSNSVGPGGASRPWGLGAFLTLN